jgi:hypothetical protein
MIAIGTRRWLINPAKIADVLVLPMYLGGRESDVSDADLGTTLRVRSAGEALISSDSLTIRNSKGPREVDVRPILRRHPFEVL